MAKKMKVAEVIPRIKEVAPSGCTYWKFAAEGRSFYTEASDHCGCPIGAHTHGIELPTEQGKELEGVVAESGPGPRLETLYTANDHEPLIARNKEIYGNATPSSSAVAASGLLRLGKLCGCSSYLQAAEEVLRLGVGVMDRSAIAGAQLLIALDTNLGPTPENVMIGHQQEPETAAVLSDLRRRFVCQTEWLPAERPPKRADHRTWRSCLREKRSKTVRQPYSCARISRAKRPWLAIVHNRNLEETRKRSTNHVRN